jgi:plasmid stabilization system protein ParE
MNHDDVEAEALKLEPAARARLATRLLASLETLSDQENLRLWTEEAERRDASWDAQGHGGHAAAEVLREARARLG